MFSNIFHNHVGPADAEKTILEPILVVRHIKSQKSSFSCEIPIIHRNIALARTVGILAHLETFSKCTQHVFKAIS